MTYLYRKVKDWVVIDISNEINYEVSLSLKKNIEEIYSNGENKIAINLKGVNFIGSLALGIFSFGKKLMNEIGGDICILHPNETIKETLTSTEMIRLVRIINSEDEL